MQRSPYVQDLLEASRPTGSEITPHALDVDGRRVIVGTVVARANDSEGIGIVREISSTTDAHGRVADEETTVRVKWLTGRRWLFWERPIDLSSIERF